MRVTIAQTPLNGHTMGASIIQALLRHDGHQVTTLDLDLLLALSDRPFHLEVTRFLVRGLENRATGIYRGDAMLYALFGTDPAGWPLAAGEADLIGRLVAVADDHAETILSTDPGLVLFGLTAQCMLTTALVARALKERRLDLPVVAAGPGLLAPEVLDLMLRLGVFDLALPGQCEGSVRDLLDDLAAGGDGRRVRGVSFIEPGGRRIDRRRPLEPYEDLPFPDLDGIPFPGANIRMYLAAGKMFLPNLPIRTVRGCANKCSFCYEVSQPGFYEQRRVDRLIEEFEVQIERYRNRAITFCDSAINGDPAWLETLVDGLTGRGVRFFAPFAHAITRSMSPSLLQRMADLGFYRLYYGAESFSRFGLKTMVKRTEVEEMKQVIVDTARVGIHPTVNIVLAYHGEPRSSMHETAGHIHDLMNRVEAAGIPSSHWPDFQIFRTFLSPEGAVFQRPEKFGVRIEPIEMPLPADRPDLIESAGRIVVQWSDGLDDNERDYAAQLIGGIVSRYPKERPEEQDYLAKATHHFEPSMAFALDAPGDVEIVGPFADGRHAVRRAGRPVREVDAVGALVWRRMVERRRFRFDELAADVQEATGLSPYLAGFDPATIFRLVIDRELTVLVSEDMVDGPLPPIVADLLADVVADGVGREEPAVER